MYMYNGFLLALKIRFILSSPICKLSITVEVPPCKVRQDTSHNKLEGLPDLFDIKPKFDIFIGLVRGGQLGGNLGRPVARNI